jgi:hypothetical protein
VLDAEAVDCVIIPSVIISICALNRIPKALRVVHLGPDPIDLEICVMVLYSSHLPRKS